MYELTERAVCRTLVSYGTWPLSGRLTEQSSWIGIPSDLDIVYSSCSTRDMMSVSSFISYGTEVRH